MQNMTTLKRSNGLTDSVFYDDSQSASFDSHMGRLKFEVNRWGLLSLDWSLQSGDDRDMPALDLASTKSARGVGKATVCTWTSNDAKETWGPGDEQAGDSSTRRQGPYSVERLRDQTTLQLEAYFSGRRRTFDLPVVLSGTRFQLDVWHYLMRIPYGNTRSYGDVAHAIHRAQAVRAVGQANRANPIAIVVPCHRVIGSSGKLVGYAGAHVHLKEGLLSIEQSTVLQA